MGGSFEKNLTAPRSTSLTSPVRTHINKSTGEVHFHDDKANKKCAITVADYHAAMSDFDNKVSVGQKKTLVGVDGKTAVHWEKIINDQGEVDAEITVDDVSIGSNLQMLKDLAAGK